MKLFRRISVLTLVFVLVCLFSTSAFAGSFYDPQVYDDESVLLVEANLTTPRNVAWMEIHASGLTQCHLEIDCIYDYKDKNDNARSGAASDITIDPYDPYCGISITTENSAVGRFTEATYTFFASYTAAAGEAYYNPPSQTLRA